MGCLSVCLFGAKPLYHDVHCLWQQGTCEHQWVLQASVVVCHNVVSARELKYDHPLVGLALLDHMLRHIIWSVLEWTLSTHWHPCGENRVVHIHPSGEVVHVVHATTLCRFIGCFTWPTLWVGIMHHAIVLACDCVYLILQISGVHLCGLDDEQHMSTLSGCIVVMMDV